MKTEYNANDISLNSVDSVHPHKNIIIVGTKTDLCNDKSKNKNRRKVPFSRAIELASKLRLAGCIETSSRLNSRTGFEDIFFNELNDVFGMAGCLCVDQTTRDL